MRIILSTVFILASYSTLTAQDIIPIIDVQGETVVSPYVDQVATINGKVTEPFGDPWHIQDEFGAWNGIYVIEETLMIPANPPFWAEPRQPEVGDELTLSIAEEATIPFTIAPNPLSENTIISANEMIQAYRIVDHEWPGSIQCFGECDQL
ncbi:MAG: hypothetical protein ACI84C_002312 [Flavobacteriales bacterium]|jgi:hypothetical protein